MVSSLLAFRPQICMHSHLSHACYMPHLSHPPSFDHLNNIWRRSSLYLHAFLNACTGVKMLLWPLFGLRISRHPVVLLNISILFGQMLLHILCTLFFQVFPIHKK